MNNTVKVQGFRTKPESSEKVKLQLTHYLGQQPESTQVFHRWMKRLEAASLGIIVAAFILAMYISINWTAVEKIFIPIAWFIFAASVTPTMVLIGIHSVILRTFSPVVLPGKVQMFVAGPWAMWLGWGIVLGGLAIATFWGLFAYSVWTLNLAMLESLIRFLTAVMGIGIAICILYTMIRQITRTR